LLLQPTVNGLVPAVSVQQDQLDQLDHKVLPDPLDQGLDILTFSALSQQMQILALVFLD
jgi:hypothetical protein